MDKIFKEDCEYIAKNIDIKMVRNIEVYFTIIHY